MFEQLLNFSKPANDMGIIWSIQGGHYLALQLNPEGDIIKQADHPFSSFYQAQEWLKHNGINTISLRQTPAYFEMIGLDA